MIAISSNSALGRPGVVPRIQMPQSVLDAQPAEQALKAISPTGPQQAVRAAAESKAQSHLGQHVDARV